MQIQKLIINEYGAFKDRTITLESGMNIIEGNNESGKSTLQAFIRFMLYGMPRKSSGTVNDRDRGISWSGGVAGGSMEVTVPDKNGEPRAYRIERHGQLRGATGHENYAETCKIIDLATGTEVFEGQEPGKALLGISQETFVSTTFIRQMECATVDGVGVNASIENLLFAANEGINTEKATAKLDEYRKVLLHKNGRGGLLFELEAEKLILEEKLARAKEAAETIVNKEATVAALAALESELGAKVRECESAMSLYEACTVLRRFDDLHEHERKLAALERGMEELLRGKGYDGPLPTRDTIDDTLQLDKKLAELSSSDTLGKAELAKAQNAPDGDRTLAEHADKVEENGGKSALLATFARLTKKRKLSKPFSIVSYIVGGLALLVGGAATAFALLFNAPVLYPDSLILAISTLLSGGDLGALAQNLQLPYLIICFAVLGFGLLLTVLGILLSVSARDAKKRRAVLAERVGLYDKNVTRDSFSAHLDRCLAERERCLAYDENVRIAKEESDRRASLLAAHLEACLTALAVFDVIPENTDAESVSSALRATAEILTAICRERERLEGETQNARALTASIAESLSGYNERNLRSMVGDKDPAAILSSTDVEKLDVAFRYQKDQLAAATAKRIAVEKELIALTASSENPAKLYAKLDELTAELRDKRFQYESLVMAMEAISTASDGLRKSVTPRIRESAGKTMSKLTDGKYGELGVAQDMSVHVFAGNSTRSIDVLSKGTRDAAYLSLRMALAELVCSGNLPPLTLDESLSLLDETRAANMLAMLYEYTQNGAQCLLFTCHKREGQLMSAIGSYNHIQLT